MDKVRIFLLNPIYPNAGEVFDVDVKPVETIAHYSREVNKLSAYSMVKGNSY